MLVDLAAQFDRKVAFVGRSMDAELRDRAAARLPAHPVRRRRSATPTCRTTPSQDVLCLDHRLAGRAAGGAVAHRHRRSPLRQARRPTTPSCSRRARFPATRRRSAASMNHIARRGADVVTEAMQARARLGPRQRRRAEAGAVAGAAALLRAGPRRVPPAGAARARRQARDAAAADRTVQVLLAEDGDIMQFDARRRAHRRQGADRPRADRRHADRRGRRRGAARSPPPRRRRPGRAGRRDQPRRPARSTACPNSSRAASSSTTKPATLLRDAAGVHRRVHRRVAASRSGPTRG